MSFPFSPAVEISIAIFLFLVITTVNSLTIAAVAVYQHLRTVPNMYVTSLAVADLLVGVWGLCRVLWVLPIITDYMRRNETACLLYVSIFFILMTFSTLSMLLIAFDRFMYILYPLHYPGMMSKQLVLIIILSSWGVAVVYGTVPMYTSHFDPDIGCQPTHLFSESYMTIAHPILFFTILFLTIILYAIIIKAVLRQQRLIYEQRCSQNSMAPNKGRLSYGVVRMLLLVFGLFAICWTPLMVVLALEYTVHVHHLYLDICIFIVSLHSALNFFVYAAMNLDFQKAFKRLLCKVNPKHRPW